MKELLGKMNFIARRPPLERAQRQAEKELSRLKRNYRKYRDNKIKYESLAAVIYTQELTEERLTAFGARMRPGLKIDDVKRAVNEGFDRWKDND